MKLAVTDANIFIDLIHLDLVESFFSLNYEFHTSYEIYEELKEIQKTVINPFKIKNQLLIQTPTLIKAEDLKIPTSKLSSSDVSAILLALQLSSKILSGDRMLKKVAEENNIEVHGILWVIEAIMNAKIISKDTACQKAELLMKVNKRLPTDECIAKIKSWKK